MAKSKSKFFNFVVISLRLLASFLCEAVLL